MIQHNYFHLYLIFYTSYLYFFILAKFLDTSAKPFFRYKYKYQTSLRKQF